ncbi:hypothetical protein A0H81_08593 [Grifola frondosa]|uniref:Uncharacterized protein n=1 Tax=Grifola frondosa TaxID=5627 RepID=A0A1C7M349_GRIFR|nr:hypothetical protein A0H81_08593 [Grifola frondosa]
MSVSSLNPDHTSGGHFAAIEEPESLSATYGKCSQRKDLRMVLSVGTMGTHGLQNKNHVYKPQLLRMEKPQDGCDVCCA